MANESNDRDPFPCVDCGMPLPIEVIDAPDAKPLVCAQCGSRYRGRLWPSIPDRLKGNVLELKD